MSQAVITFFTERIASRFWSVILLSLFPIIELRGAIPVGVSLGYNQWMAYLVAFLGSSLPVPFLLLLLKPILNLLKKMKWFRGLAQAVEDIFNEKANGIVEKAVAKNKDKAKDPEKLAEKYKLIGVLLFVAIPVPLTGVWTGSAVAAFLNLDFKKALPVILLGNLSAGFIVTIFTILLGAYLNIIIDVMIVLFALLFVYFIYKVLRRIIKNKRQARKTSNQQKKYNNMEKTNAMRIVAAKKLPYKEYFFALDEAVSGVEMAALIGKADEVDRVFKTLVTVAKSGTYYVFMIPVAKELDLKKAAAAVGEKNVEMIKSKELLPLTGYVHGGCSPIGMKKQFKTCLDQSAKAYPTIIFSGGKIGYQIEMAPSDLLKVVQYKFAELVRE